MILHELFEILVRRGDDAHVDFHRRVTADAIELAVGEHAQQSRLGFGRHVADFIEKQTAAVGLLETALTLLCRAGERAFLVAE